MSKGFEEGLAEALGKTITIVNTVEERYRDLAFPIILQTIIRSTDPSNSESISRRDIGEQERSELRLSPNLSVNEFFRSAAPSSHPERFVCAAYYLLHTGKAEKFTTAEILDIYGKLRQAKPGNPADIVYKCIKKVHIIDAPDSTNKLKYWVITPDGEKFVEGLLNDNASGGNTNAK